MFTVHNAKWLTEQPAGKIARTLMEKGYTFDYISDAQLLQTRNEWTGIAPRSTQVWPAYRTIVVPATRRMPVATLKKLAQLAAEGRKIVFERLPEDVPGYGHLDERRAEFRKILAGLSSNAVVNSDIISAFPDYIRREPLADAGLNFIRRSGGPSYFVTNLTAKSYDGWVKLSSPADAVSILNPLTDQIGLAAQSPKGIYLQLAPGESLILAASPTKAGAPWPYRQPAAAPIALTGPWKISFLKGGPELPPALETTTLKSWTELGGDEAQRFGGTARYRIEFDAPTAKADDWLLDLGDVRESARVILNGQPVATAWSIPFRVRLAAALLKPGRNVLELDVTNLAANRIRYMDQNKLPWKIMRDTNVVNINYRPFDASAWPLTPSGLLGPVTLTPLKAFAPH